MGQKYLIDSNVIIDYTSSRLPDPGTAFVEEIFNTDFFISVVVKIEVLGYNDAVQKMQRLEHFIATAYVFMLNDNITSQTITLRKTIPKLKLGDAIIAATALTNHLTLITRNTSDFQNIPGLELFNPWEL